MAVDTTNYSWTTVGFPLRKIMLQAWYSRADQGKYDSLVGQAEAFVAKAMGIDGAQAKEVVSNFTVK